MRYTKSIIIHIRPLQSLQQLCIMFILYIYLVAFVLEFFEAKGEGVSGTPEGGFFGVEGC